MYPVAYTQRRGGGGVEPSFLTLEFTSFITVAEKEEKEEEKGGGRKS